METAATTTLGPENTRSRLAVEISSSAALVAFISPGQPGQTATNSYDVASVPPVAGDDPVNESDPSGLSGDGDPYFACQNSTGRDHLQICAAEEYAQPQKIDSVENTNPTLKSENVPCTSSTSSSPGISGSTTLELPPVFIPGPASLTIQNSVSLAGPDAPVSVDLQQDGSVDAGVGSSHVDFSSAGAVSGASQDFHGVSVATDGSLSYTTTASKSLESDSASVSTTATISHGDVPPPGSLIPTVEKATGGSILIVVIARLAVAGACQVLGGGPEDPASDVCSVAAAG